MRNKPVLQDQEESKQEESALVWLYRAFMFFTQLFIYWAALIIIYGGGT